MISGALYHLVATYSVSIPVWSCSGSAILAKPKSHILEEREGGREGRGRKEGREGGGREGERVKENTDKRNTENSTKLETQCQNTDTDK